MNWADAVPNLLIGLREGLEAGLVVSILLAALHKANATLPAGRQVSTAAIWLGVLGAVSLAGSFAAVLTYSTTILSSSAQEAIGGALSVVAVVLVTGMIFWMRKTARSLSGQLRGDVERALAIGAGALTLTAFFAVGREGLETTLFLWTAVKASGSTVAPLIGAAIGIVIAITLCWLLYRRAIHLDLGKFFTWTALALIVIAAGVLAYGLGDLQDAGLLPGSSWVAFDLSAHIDPTSWWVTLISGTTELTPKMTVLQIVAWAVYLVVVLTMFLRADAVVPAAASTPEANLAARDTTEPARPRWERWAQQRTLPVALTLIAVPVLVAVVVILALPTPTSTDTAVTVTADSCAHEWNSAHSGTQSIDVANKSSHAGEINLDDASGGVVGEIETLGPGTTATLTATLGSGTYSFVCLMPGGTTRSAAVTVTGHDVANVLAVKPVTIADLTGPNNAYQAYAAQTLTTLAGDVAALRSAVASGDLAGAQKDWLTAQLDWERVGASYDSFGDKGQAVDGLPDGLPGGVNDPGFTGLHRVEYGLYHGQGPSQLLPVIDQLTTDIGVVRQNLTTDDEAGDPTNLPIRVHEILEDAQRDHLSGIDDLGSHTAYAATSADTQITRVVLAEVAPLVQARDPGLVATITRGLDTLDAALNTTRTPNGWQPSDTVTLAQRQQVNAALGAVLQSLSDEPGLLEVPPSS
ncbi:MAG: FTR1 family protein [Gordonia polyisoprenivorans]|nr:FTR1 family protein [Gordonia polyisoprenivorans]